MNTVLSSIMFIFRDAIANIESSLGTVTLTHLVAIGAILINAIWFTIYFLTTRYILKNRLNLE